MVTVNGKQYPEALLQPVQCPCCHIWIKTSLAAIQYQWRQQFDKSTLENQDFSRTKAKLFSAVHCSSPTRWSYVWLLSKSSAIVRRGYFLWNLMRALQAAFLCRRSCRRKHFSRTTWFRSQSRRCMDDWWHFSSGKRVVSLVSEMSAEKRATLQADGSKAKISKQAFHWKRHICFRVNRGRQRKSSYSSS